MWSYSLLASGTLSVSAYLVMVCGVSSPAIMALMASASLFLAPSAMVCGVSSPGVPTLVASAILFWWLPGLGGSSLRAPCS